MKYSLNLASGTFVNHRRLYVIFSIVTLFLLGLLIVNTMSLFRDSQRTRQLELRLNELRAQKKSANQQSEVSAASLAEMAKRIETANTLLMRDDYRWTTLLGQLESHLADGISIRDLQPDFKTGVLRVSGVAISIEELRSFIDNLSRSDVFTNVYLKEQHAERSADDSVDGYSFSLELMKRSGDES